MLSLLRTSCDAWQTFLKQPKQARECGLVICRMPFKQPTRRGWLLKKTFLRRMNWAVVITQLVEWSLPTPEVCGSNPNLSKNLIYHWYIWIDNNGKRGREWPVLKKEDKRHSTSIRSLVQGCICNKLGRVNKPSTTWDTNTRSLIYLASALPICYSRS